MEIHGRLLEERQRLALNQSEMAEIGGVSKNTQINYEAGRSAPDARYLAALSQHGLDVLYVVRGVRQSNVSPSPEQSRLLDAYAATAGQGRRAALLLMESLAGYGPAKAAPEDDPELWRKVARGVPTAPGVNPASRLTAQQWLEIVEEAYRIEMAQQAQPAASRSVDR